MNAVKIFVKLLDGDGDLWRSTSARTVAADVYEVLGIARPDEKWEFAPGTRVRCESRRFSDGSLGLVAARLAVDG